MLGKTRVINQNIKIIKDSIQIYLIYRIYGYHRLNPRLAKGGGDLEESNLGHEGNLFCILCGHLMKKKATLPGDTVNLQSQGGTTFSSFFDILSRHFEKKNICIL